METIITELLKNEYSPVFTIALVSYVCVYLWKHYQKVLKITIGQTDRNHEILNEINEISKSSKLTEEIINDNIEKLGTQITNLENRLFDLEKMCLNNNISNKQVIDEINNIRKSIEIFHAIKYVKEKE